MQNRSYPLTNKVLLSFSLASINEIAKRLHVYPNKQCDLDPIHTFVLKQVSATIILASIINLSLSTGTSPIHFK